MSTRFYGSHFLDHEESNTHLSANYSGDGSGVVQQETWAETVGSESLVRGADLNSRGGDGASTHFPLHELSVPTNNTFLSGHYLQDVTSARVIDMPFTPRLTKRTPASESWKLVCLVFAFFVWISTASTLLFLYMDRYLFG